MGVTRTQTLPHVCAMKMHLRDSIALTTSCTMCEWRTGSGRASTSARSTTPRKSSSRQPPRISPTGSGAVNGASISGRIETRSSDSAPRSARPDSTAGALAERGALIELTHEEAYLADGRFSVERMLTMLRESIEQAAADGFSGWRGCGEMSWLLAGAPGSEQIVRIRSAAPPVLLGHARMRHVPVQPQAAAGAADGYGPGHPLHRSHRRTAAVQSRSSSPVTRTSAARQFVPTSTAG